MRTFVVSLGHACRGLKTAWKQERNFRIQVGCSIFVVCIGLYLDFTWGEWLLVLLTITMVLSAELINTALEYILDHLSPQQSKEAGTIKDIAAGMVLLVSVVAEIIGVGLLLHHFNYL